jgi:hypothetical protein
MSDTNGAGNVVPNVVFMPGRNGGKLRRGGPIHAGPGRPPSAIRALAREDFADLVPELRRIAKSPKATTSDRLKAIDLLGKYGLGTTVTETDTEGRDAIRVIREPTRARVSD